MGVSNKLGSLFGSPYDEGHSISGGLHDLGHLQVMSSSRPWRLRRVPHAGVFHNFWVHFLYVP